MTASRDADTVVVGAGGHGVVGNILLGSTSVKVAGHASCPVVVVRGSADASSAHRTVVVGFDGSDLSVDALGYAFAAAAQRGLPLDVVTSWEPELSTYLSPGVAEENRAAAAAHQKEIAVSAVSSWRGKHPSVEVRIHVTTDRAADSLIARSADAALVVVGSRGLGSVRGLLLGSVSGELLRHAESPVVIVRPATDDSPSARGG